MLLFKLSSSITLLISKNTGLKLFFFFFLSSSYREEHLISVFSGWASSPEMTIVIEVPHSFNAKLTCSLLH